MKKSVLIFILGLIIFSGFIIAQDHPCQGGDGSIHGVEIGGECFNCNSTFSDGICPDEFSDTKVCIEEWDFDCPPPVKENWWSESSSGYPAITPITEEDPTYFKQREADPLLIDLQSGKTLYLTIINTGLSQGENITFWIFESTGMHDVIKEINGSVSNGKSVVPFRIENIADLNGKESDGDPKEENKEGDILELYFYTNITDYDSIVYSLFINTTYGEAGPSTKDCGIYNTLEECENDDDDQDGVEDYRTEGDCTYVSYTICTWDGDSCNNDLGPETILEGTEEECEEGRRVITCSYTSGDSIGNCDAGDDFFKATYTSTQEGCDAWESGPIPCPRQLRVPFFGFYSFIASLFIIGLLYFLINKRFIK